MRGQHLKHTTADNLALEADLDAVVARLKRLHAVGAPVQAETPAPQPVREAITGYQRARGWLMGLDAASRLQCALVTALLDTVPKRPTSDDPAEEQMLRSLEGLQRLLLQHPAAMQALYSGLVAQGRAWAQTPEGQRQYAALAASERVRQARVIWETTTLNVLEAQPVGALPSAYLEALVAGAGTTKQDAGGAPIDAEALLARLFRLTQSTNAEAA
jgi:hypothetical protein